MLNSGDTIVMLFVANSNQNGFCHMSIQEEDIEVLQQRDLSKTEVSAVY
jgi:hypothetical protein